MKKQTKGFFISFEGGEATGKTTQIKKIRNWFKKNKVPHTLTREPGVTKLSENLVRLLQNKLDRQITATYLIWYFILTYSDIIYFIRFNFKYR